MLVAPEEVGFPGHSPPALGSRGRRQGRGCLRKTDPSVPSFCQPLTRQDWEPPRYKAARLGCWPLMSEKRTPKAKRGQRHKQNCCALPLPLPWLPSALCSGSCAHPHPPSPPSQVPSTLGCPGLSSFVPQPRGLSKVNAGGREEARADPTCFLSCLDLEACCPFWYPPPRPAGFPAVVTHINVGG